MKRHSGLTCVILAVVALVGAGALFYFEAWPLQSTLIIHAPEQGWKSISILIGPQYDGASNIGLLATPPRREVRVSPFPRGQYEVWVKFADDKFARVTFFHSSARAERVMNIYASRDPNSSRADVRMVVNGRTFIYSGNVTAADSLHPFPLILMRM